MNYKEDPLWQRIEAFKLDDGDARHPFTHKLLQEYKWQSEFTERAVAEYKKFIYLCVIIPKGASPSPIVDQVWHMHLTYSKNYWEDFCQNTLYVNLHHNPSKGGEEEVVKHRQWYNETIQQYKEVFETDPPIDIWPAKYEAEPLWDSFWKSPLKTAIVTALAVTAFFTYPILLIPLIFLVATVEGARYPNKDGANGNGCGSGCSSGCSSGCGSGCGGGCGGCGS